MSKPLGTLWQKALDMHHQGCTTVQIATAINSTPKNVNTWLNKRGLTANLHRPHYTEAQRLEICRYAEQHGNTAAANHFNTSRETVSKWMIARGMTPARSRKQKPGAVKVIPEKFPKLAEVRDASVKLKWRGERFRLVKDHSLLRYFIVRRGDDLPKFCTLEHRFEDGRLAIHDCELVVSARALRLHPKYTSRIAAMPGINLYDHWSRKLLVESGLIRHSDDAELVALLLAMVSRDRSRGNVGASNE